jgi:hypothetical protein
MNYKQQSELIEKLAKSVIKKSKNFAKKNINDSPYYDDLKSVISDLKDIDNWLK